MQWSKKIKILNVIFLCLYFSYCRLDSFYTFFPEGLKYAVKCSKRSYQVIELYCRNSKFFVNFLYIIYL